MIGSYDGWCVCYPGWGEMVRLRNEGMSEWRKNNGPGKLERPRGRDPTHKLTQLANSLTHAAFDFTASCASSTRSWNASVKKSVTARANAAGIHQNRFHCASVRFCAPAVRKRLNTLPAIHAPMSMPTPYVTSTKKPCA